MLLSADIDCIRQAKLNTFERDLKLHDDNFNTAVSILNVGLVLCNTTTTSTIMAN